MKRSTKKPPAKTTKAKPKPKVIKKPTGAPSKYRLEFDEQARKLCLLGATDQELADFFEVVEDTINEWKKVYPSFSVSVKNGKVIADAEIANSLYKRAKGFSFKSEKVFNNEGLITRAKTSTYVPPDSGAAMNWLKNRQPDKWREKTEVEHSGSLDVIKVGYGKREEETD